MSEYLECIGLFYDEKLKFLSSGDKYISCGGCDTTKKFKETSDEITLTCGGTGTKCGMKISIKFPRYLRYDDEIDKLHSKIEEGLNLSVLNKYIDQGKLLSKEERRINGLEEELNIIKKRVNQISIEDKKERIQRFYDTRIEKTGKCDRIFNKLCNGTIAEDTKDLLRKDYVRLIKELNSDYIEVKEFIDKINPFLEVKEPVVTICDISNMDNVSKKKKVKKDVKEERLIKYLLDHMYLTDGILTKEDYMEIISDKFKTKWGPVLFNSLQFTKSNNPWKKKEQERIGNIIKEPLSPDDNKIELTEQWMEHLQVLKGKDDSKNKREKSIGKVVKNIISCNGYKNKDEMIELWGESSKGSGILRLEPLYDLVKKELSKKNKKWRNTSDTAIVRAAFQKNIYGYKQFKEYLRTTDCKGSDKDKTGNKKKEGVDSYEPEPEPEPEPEINFSEDMGEVVFTPKSLDEIEEGLKIKWKSPDGEVLNGYIDIMDKRKKTNVSIIINDGDSEIKLKDVPLSDIEVIR